MYQYIDGAEIQAIEEAKEIFKKLSSKSSKIKASMQLKYLKYKLCCYLDSFPMME